MLEILSLVYILFIILWAFKLIIESFDDEIQKFYQEYHIKGYDTEIEELEKELELWLDTTQKMNSLGIEIPPEHRAEFTRIFSAMDILLQKKTVARLKQYR